MVPFTDKIRRSGNLHREDREKVLELADKISVFAREIGSVELNLIGDVSVYYIYNYPPKLGKDTY